MNKAKTQNLDDVLKTINRRFLVSFAIILTFFIIIVSTIFINYRNKERELISQKLNTTFSTFVSKMSQKLYSFYDSIGFEEYIHSGPVSREDLYAPFLFNFRLLKLDAVSGMDIFRDEESIFSYGVKTKDSVTLDLGGDHNPAFHSANRLYRWKLYFKWDVIAKELKKINPELMDCDDCNKKIITEDFGGFPVLQFSGMDVNLDIKNSLSISLWRMIFLVIGALLALVIWNMNRVKNIFRKYLSDPIVEITSKIKENEVLPQSEIEELSYLTKQIDQWKDQTVELEKVRAEEKSKEEKIKIMQSIGASIAHELRTPLRSIASGTSGIKKFLPPLLKGYIAAEKSNLLDESIKPQQIKLLHKVLANLESEEVSANTIIDMFLMKIKDSIAGSPNMERLSVTECVNKALQRYSFKGLEKDLIICDLTNDFQFKGDEILVVHILFNLLKNALYYIARVRKGKIYIHFEQGERENMLHFKDTGKGIAKEVLPNIFDKFYSQTEGGVGIGLSFCKMAMEWMGGNITCQSIEGEYTEFTLHFPKFDK